MIALRQDLTALTGHCWLVLSPEVRVWSVTILSRKTARYLWLKVKLLHKGASDVRCVVVGNPCNTNALIAQHNCREVPATRFSAMTMLDENRAKAQLAKKAGVNVGEIKNLAIWGNHSSTMFLTLRLLVLAASL